MGEVRITDEMMARAIAAFDAACSEPPLVKCKRCDGKGYHHGFGKTGADPDWCSDCGGGGVELAKGEEHRPLRAALSAALSGMAEAVAWTDGFELSSLDNPDNEQGSALMFRKSVAETVAQGGLIPLFTTPPASGLREENERLRKALQEAPNIVAQWAGTYRLQAEEYTALAISKHVYPEVKAHCDAALNPEGK